MKRNQLKEVKDTSRPVCCEDDEEDEGLQEASSFGEPATEIRCSRSRSLSLVAIAIGGLSSAITGSPYWKGQPQRCAA